MSAIALMVTVDCVLIIRIGDINVITCPICKKFVKHTVTIVNGLDEIVRVEAVCKKHGGVDADYDDYEEVVGEELPL